MPLALDACALGLRASLGLCCSGLCAAALSLLTGSELFSAASLGLLACAAGLFFRALLGCPLARFFLPQWTILLELGEFPS